MVKSFKPFVAEWPIVSSPDLTEKSAFSVKIDQKNIVGVFAIFVSVKSDSNPNKRPRQIF